MSFIVLTTINPPNDVIRKFLSFKKWDMIVVGDQKTPHEEYIKMEKEYSNLYYLHPQLQENKYKTLSDLIGWNRIQRRNIGYIEAFKRGAIVIASVDDDNMPYDSWDKDIKIGTDVECQIYHSNDGVLDPLSIASKTSPLWHRGYPIDLLHKRRDYTQVSGKIRVLIQENFWSGDPDIDAICRITHSNPQSDYSDTEPFSVSSLAPFNSQNTFIHRDVIKFFSCLPHCGRMDDIWGSYILQEMCKDKMPCILYDKATVHQDRGNHSFDGNQHTVVNDLEREMIGYKHTNNLVKNIGNYRQILDSIDPRIIQCADEYQSEFQDDIPPYLSLVCVGRNDNYV